MELNHRNQYLNDLKVYISQKKATFTSLFTSLGAKPRDEESQTTTRSSSEKVGDDDLNFPEILPTSKNYIKIDPELQEEIIKNALKYDSDSNPGLPDNEMKIRPLANNLQDLQTNFSPAERLALYNYAVDQTGHFMEPELQINPETDNNATNRPSESFIDIFNRQRDAKRRRMKYKGVKGPPLTHTQEISKLIDAHMEAYQEFLKQRHGSPKRDKKQRKRSREESKKKKRHRSRSRSWSRDSRDRKKHRKHKKSRSRSRSKHKKSKHWSRHD